MGNHLRLLFSKPIIGGLEREVNGGVSAGDRQVFLWGSKYKTVDKSSISLYTKNVQNRTILRSGRE
jgi:hypothetical protein